MNKEKKYNKLKLKLSKWILFRQLKNSDRYPKTCSLEKASTVGVTFVATSPKQLDEVKNIVKELNSKGLKTITLGYIPEKKPNEYYLSEKTFNMFYDKELDMLFRPKNSAAIEFQETEFDILIDLGSNSYYPMLMLLTKSKAHFKVGKFNKNSLFDLMIDVKGSNDLKYYFDQVVHYLSKFN